MNEKHISTALEKMTAMNRSASQEEIQKAASPVLIENTCHKRKYTIGNVKIILFQGADGSLAAKTTSDVDPSCLPRAEARLKEVDLPSASYVLASHREKFSELWNDPELRPDGWLNCKSNEADFNESLAMFIHEISHDLRNDECLFLAETGKYLCFAIKDQRLPLRSYASRKSFPTKRIEAQQGLSRVQEMYLVGIDQPLIGLLDELIAYTINVMAFNALTDKLGSMALSEPGSDRPGVFLPLFLNYTTRYLSRLKREKPGLFEEFFSNNSQNRKGVEVLLGISEKHYQAWLVRMKKLKFQERDWEHNLFAEYNSEKKQLGLHTAKLQD